MKLKQSFTFNKHYILIHSIIRVEQSNCCPYIFEEDLGNCCLKQKGFFPYRVVWNNTQVPSSNVITSHCGYSSVGEARKMHLFVYVNGGSKSIRKVKLFSIYCMDIHFLNLCVWVSIWKKAFKGKFVIALHTGKISACEIDVNFT